MKQFAICLILLVGSTLHAAEVIPPAPYRHFNDYAGLVSPSVQSELDARLLVLDQKESTQIVVAIFQKMQSDSSLDDYAVRVFQAWKVGQKGKNNGAVLFVFLDNHQMRIQTGYGLEGALPDALCKQIIDQEIAPRFRSKDYDGGMRAGVNAMINAVHGEYKAKPPSNAGGILCLIIGLFLFALFIMRAIQVAKRGGRYYGRRGWYSPTYIGGFGGGWGGGGGWSGGGGGFSGGGGSTGGGGASGSW